MAKQVVIEKPYDSLGSTRRADFDTAPWAFIEISGPWDAKNTIRTQLDSGLRRARG